MITISYNDTLDKDHVIGIIFYHNVDMGRLQILKAAWPLFREEMEGKGVRFTFNYGV